MIGELGQENITQVHTLVSLMLILIAEILVVTGTLFGVMIEIIWM